MQTAEFYALLKKEWELTELLIILDITEENKIHQWFLILLQNRWDRGDNMLNPKQAVHWWKNSKSQLQLLYYVIWRHIVSFLTVHKFPLKGLLTALFFAQRNEAYSGKSEYKCLKRKGMSVNIKSVLVGIFT